MKEPPSTLTIAWYRSEAGIPGIHFRPELWALICELAGQRGASPEDVVSTYIDALVSMNTKATSCGDWPQIELEWLTYGGSDGETPQAVLAFQADAMSVIAKRWNASEDEARKVIADALLQSINEQYEMSCLTG